MRRKMINRAVSMILSAVMVLSAPISAGVAYAEELDTEVQTVVEMDESETLLEENTTDVASEVTSEETSVEITETEEAATVETTEETETETETTTVETTEETAEEIELEASNFEVDAEGRISLVEGASIGTSMVLPKEAKIIPAGIFTGKTQITTLTIESGGTLEKIEANAFKNCSALTTVPTAGVKSFGDSAFEGCKKLSTCSIASATSFGEKAFYGCTLFNGRTGVKSTVLEFSDKITNIGNYAFAGTGMTAISLTNLKSSVSFGDYVFSGCLKLNDVEWNASINTVNEGTFFGCSVLEEITLPANVDTVEAWAFGNCEKLTMVYIEYPKAGASLSIDADAFPYKVGAGSWIVLRGYNEYIDEYCDMMYNRGYLFKSVPIDQVKYNITGVNVANQGKVVLGATEAVAGATVTATLAPLRGYLPDEESISIRKSGGGQVDPISVTPGAADSLIVTFIMPAKNVTVSCNFISFDSSKVTAFKLSMPDKTPETDGYEFYYAKDGKRYLVFETTGITSDAVKIEGWCGNTSLGYMSPTMFNWYSDNPYVTVTADGKVTTTIMPKWAVIQGQLKSDTSKKISFHVRAKAVTVVDDLRMDFSTTTAGIELPADRNSLDENGNYVISLPASKVRNSNLYINVTARPVRQGGSADENLSLYTDWVSSDSKYVQPVNSRCLGTNKILIGKGTTGEYVISASVANTNTSTGAPAVVKRDIIIKIIDSTPRLSVSSFKLNMDSTTGQPFELIPVYDTEICTDVLPKIIDKRIVNGTEKIAYYSGMRVTYDSASNTYYMLATDDSGCKAGGTLNFTTLYIRGTYKGADGKSMTFDTPIPSVQIYKLATGSQISVKAQVTGKLNLFYQDSRAGYVDVSLDSIGETLDTTANKCFVASSTTCTAKPSDDAFTKNFDVTVVNDKLVRITRTSNDLSRDINNKIPNSGYLYLKYAGLKNYVMVKVTIPYAVTYPSYRLVATSARASQNGKNQEFITQLIDAKTKAVVDITSDISVSSDNSNFTVTADEETDFITVKCNGTPVAQRFNIVVQDDNWENALKYPFTMQITAMGVLPTVKFTNAALKINTRITGLSDSTSLYSVNQADAAVSDIDSWEYVGAVKLADEAAKIDITNSGNVVTAKVTDSSIKAGTYKFRVYPVISYPGVSPIASTKPVVFTVTIVNIDPTATVTTGAAKLSTICPGSETVYMGYKINGLPSGNAIAVADQTVVPFNANDVIAKNLIDKGLISFDFDTPGCIEIKLTGSASAYTGCQAFNCKFKVTGMVATDGSGGEVAVKDFPIIVRGNANKPVITVKGTGKINAIDLTSCITYTTKVTNIASDIDTLEVYDVNGSTTVASQYFEVTPVAPGDWSQFTFSVKDGVNLDATVTYRYAFGCTLSADSDSVVRYTAVINYKPVQAFPKLTVTETRNSVYMGSSAENKYVTVTVDASAFPGGEIETFKLSDKNGTYYNSALEIRSEDVDDLGNGIYTFKLRVKTASKFVVDKPYNIGVEPVFKGQLKKANGTTFLAGLFVRK